jgi:hypothetical protein
MPNIIVHRLATRAGGQQDFGFGPLEASLIDLLLNGTATCAE